MANLPRKPHCSHGPRCEQEDREDYFWVYDLKSAGADEAQLPLKRYPHHGAVKP